MMLTVLWQQARRAAVTVMGDRFGVRPVISQDRHGEWMFHRASVTEDANAIDVLARLALGLLDEAAPAR
jgi:hypothetical protein